MLKKYTDSYVEYKFIFIDLYGEDKSPCVIHNKVLSNDPTRSTKLKQYMEKVHF